MSMTRQQVTLLSIFALFLAPVLLVALMRSTLWQYQPEESSNRGLLVQPPVHLPLLAESAAINGKWLILYVTADNCDRRCTDDIVSLRQIHKAAGRQGQHLSIVILNTNTQAERLQSTIESIYQEIVFIANPPAETLASLARISAGLAFEQEQPTHIRTFVADPMLNVMLAYGDNAYPGDISKDLKRLLKWSRQDK